MFYTAGLAHPADGRYRPVTRVFAAVLLAGRAMWRMPGQMPPGHSTSERTPSGPSSSASILPQHGHGRFGHRVQAGRLLAPDPRIGGNVDHKRQVGHIIEHDLVGRNRLGQRSPRSRSATSGTLLLVRTITDRRLGAQDEQ